jgi:riboflavin synthase
VFTGIVEELGEIVELAAEDDSARLRISGATVVDGTRLGDSISVDGVCLTVTEIDETEFTVDVMLETLRRSTLGGLRPGTHVNLERAARVNDRIGGHIVQGHVDGTGTLIGRTPAKHWEIVRIELPDDLNRYVVEKGSITVDGVSLTVVDVDATSFTVSLIPTTLEATTLGRKGVGDPVNLEVDVLAKYVEKLLSARHRTTEESA